ncbi:hypothetical protein [Achromobacter kerstersii]|uniref:hypothetical protein n=1 Tax=Achromobacter kerstersii TaxID=1353890 RepID=UPI001FE0DC0B|nr:hypothetical protein [Achromobacter kerstersii]
MFLRALMTMLMLMLMLVQAQAQAQALKPKLIPKQVPMPEPVLAPSRAVRQPLLRLRGSGRRRPCRSSGGRWQSASPQAAP